MFTWEHTCTCCEAGSRDRWGRSNASHSLIGPHSAPCLQRELLLFWSPKLSWTALLASLVHITRLLIGPPRTRSSVQSHLFLSLGSWWQPLLSHGCGSCGKNPLCWDLQILNGPESRLKEWLPTHIYSHHPTEASLYIVRRATKSWLFVVFQWADEYLFFARLFQFLLAVCADWMSSAVPVYSSAGLSVILCLCHQSLCAVITACQWQ